MSLAVNSCAPVSFSRNSGRWLNTDCAYTIVVLDCVTTSGNLAFVPTTLRLRHVDWLSLSLSFSISSSCGVFRAEERISSHGGREAFPPREKFAKLK